jgi:hypothetical protein
MSRLSLALTILLAAPFLSWGADQQEPPLPMGTPRGPAPAQSKAPAPVKVDTTKALVEVDTFLSMAEEVVKKAETAAVKSPSAAVALDVPGCVKTFSLEAVVAEARKGGGALADEYTEMKEPFLWDLVWYHVCAGVAEKRIEACAPLKEFHREPFPRPPSVMCENFYLETSMRRDLHAGGAAADESCIQSLSRGRSPVARENIAKFCGILRTKSSSAEKCAQLAPLFNHEAQAKKCPKFLNSIYGKSDCANEEADTKSHGVCEQYSSFARAKAGDAAACTGPICRVMNGGGIQACKPYLARIPESYCRMVVAKTSPQSKTDKAIAALAGVQADQKKFLDLSEVVHSKLWRIEEVAPTIGGPVSKEVDKREEILADMSERMEAALRRLSAVKPAEPAPPK